VLHEHPGEHGAHEHEHPASGSKNRKNPQD
jgi:hypothetical protein